MILVCLQLSKKTINICRMPLEGVMKNYCQGLWSGWKNFYRPTTEVKVTLLAQRYICTHTAASFYTTHTHTLAAYCNCLCYLNS